MTGPCPAARPTLDGRRRTLSLVLAAVGLTASLDCRARDAVLAAPYEDTFERTTLGPDWFDTGGGYRVAGGKLLAHDGYNHPAWLRKRLPRDVAIDLDVQSNSAAGDIKIELFGDGHSFDPDRGGYVSTGYVLIFGGWHNSLSVICRNNEHDDGRKAMRADRRVEPGRNYHFSVTRKAGRIDWQIDGAPFLAWTDPEPLFGNDHEFFAVNDWEADVSFDNLSVRPLP